jgi:hypothetical protein
MTSRGHITFNGPPSEFPAHDPAAVPVMPE